MSDVLKEQILEQLAGLSEDEQLHVLSSVTSLAVSANGVAGKDLLCFAGAIEKEDLQTMSRAIEEGGDGPVIHLGR